MVKWCKICGSIVDMYNEDVCKNCMILIKKENFNEKITMEDEVK